MKKTGFLDLEIRPSLLIVMSAILSIVKDLRDHSGNLFC